MTHSGGMPHKMGYRDQQYEISFFDPDANTRCVFGWTNDISDAKKMADSVELHPAWTTPWITDLFAAEQHGGHPADSAVKPNAGITGG